MPEAKILGEQPFVVSSADNPELLRTFQSYGEEGCLPLFEKKDSCLASGYRLAYYPGTRREVWVNRHGKPELIAMLKPKA